MNNEMATKVAARVIARLRVRFPSGFAGLEKNEEMLGLMIDEWAIDLGDLSMEEIEHGLNAVRNSGSTFPPSLPEFREMCRPKRISAAHKVDSLPPPKKVVSDEQARRNIANLKQIVHGVADDMTYDSVE